MAGTAGSYPADYVSEENVLLQQLWRRMNFSDRLYSAWFLLLTLALLVAPHQAVNAPRYLLLNALILECIFLTTLKAGDGPAWRVAHDWYPMLLFIVAFEEIARLSLAFVPHWQDAALLQFESSLFHIPPTQWLSHFRHPLLVEVLEFGYFSFYWMLPAVGIVLYGRGWGKSTEEEKPFRLWMDSLAIAYVVSFSIYLLFPTEGPAHTLGGHSVEVAGPFRWLVLLIQRLGGVHGNAFPSGHVMAATISVLAAIRRAPRFGWWLVAALLLMCIGAIYDGYHYLSDIVAGAALGAVAFLVGLRLLGRRAHGVN